MPNLAEFFWDLNLKLFCVRHEWRHFQDYFPQIYSNQLLFDCIWWIIKFYAFWWLTSFKPIVKLVKNWKNVWHIICHIWRNLQRLRIFHFWTKNLFCSNIVKNAQYRWMCQYRRFFATSCIKVILPKTVKLCRLFWRYWFPLSPLIVCDLKSKTLTRYWKYFP